MSMKRTSLMLAGLLTLNACATGNNPKDPLEPFNRGMTTANTYLDDYLIKPIAIGYNRVLPGVVRLGLSNFYGNLSEIRYFNNNLLQGKGERAADSFARFIVNSTFGIGGLFDIMASAGVPSRNEDFGQTLAVWGIADSPYLVLPLLGPSTVRDAFGYGGDYYLGVIDNFDDVRARNSYFGARTIHTRSELLSASDLVDEASMDRYVFLRDGYLQRRRFLIYDGNPPREYDPDDPDLPDPAEKQP